MASITSSPQVAPVGRRNAANSRCCGFTDGPWTELGNPWEGAEAETSFNSQSTYVLPVQGMNDTFIFMADRWNSKPNLPDSRYIWLPLHFDADNKPKIRWEDKWTLPTNKIAATAKHNFAIGPNDFLSTENRSSSAAAKFTPRVPPNTGGIACRWPRRWA